MIYEKKLLVLPEALSLSRRYGQKLYLQYITIFLLLQMLQTHKKFFIPKYINHLRYLRGIYRVIYYARNLRYIFIA